MSLTSTEGCFLRLLPRENKADDYTSRLDPMRLLFFLGRPPARDCVRANSICCSEHGVIGVNHVGLGLRTPQRVSRGCMVCVCAVHYGLICLLSCGTACTRLHLQRLALMARSTFVRNVLWFLSPSSSFP